MAANSGKQNFLINTSDDTSTISILGAIGDSWLSEGYTMQDVKRDLQAVSTPKIKLIVASQGGNMNDALVIHDLIKMKDAEVTSQILGATASAGTVVAQAADKGKVTMSKNAKHLIHPVWDVIMGDATELRKAASEQEKFDDTLVDMYADRIGDKKTKDEIRDLMGKEEWVSADLAKEWGFVDEVFTPGAELTTMDCYDCGLINAHKPFPNITEVDKTPAPTNNVPDNGLMNQLIQKFETLTARFNIKTPAPDPPAPANTPDQETIALLQGLKTEIQNVVTSNQDLTNKLANLQVDRDKFYDAYEKLAIKVGSKTQIESIDAQIETNESGMTDNEKSWEQNAKALRED